MKIITNPCGQSRIQRLMLGPNGYAMDSQLCQHGKIFTKLAPRPIQSKSCNVRGYVCPLSVTFYWRGMETSIQIGFIIELSKKELNFVICFGFRLKHLKKNITLLQKEKKRQGIFVHTFSKLLFFIEDLKKFICVIKKNDQVTRWLKDNYRKVTPRLLLASI